VTRDDLAVVERMFGCWGDEDLEGMLACVDPSLRWHSAVDGRVYSGHDGVREFFNRWRVTERRLEVPLQRAAELAPGVILGVGRVRMMRPGRGFADSPGVWLFRLADGRITLVESYRSERDAIRAARAQGAVPTGA
jgi:ketosteroid isomerase-like protein